MKQSVVDGVQEMCRLIADGKSVDTAFENPMFKWGSAREKGDLHSAIHSFMHLGFNPKDAVRQSIQLFKKIKVVLRISNVKSMWTQKK